MKQELQLPNTISTSDVTEFKNDPRKYGIKLRIAIQKKRIEEFNIMLDKWRQSGHTVKSGETLILNIRNEKS